MQKIDMARGYDAMLIDTRDKAYSSHVLPRRVDQHRKTLGS